MKPYIARNFIDPIECKYEIHISINNIIFGVYYIPSFHTLEGDAMSPTVGLWLGWFEVGLA
jgi:hypothetical protein